MEILRILRLRASQLVGYATVVRKTRNCGRPKTRDVAWTLVILVGGGVQLAVAQPSPLGSRCTLTSSTAEQLFSNTGLNSNSLTVDLAPDTYELQIDLSLIGFSSGFPDCAHQDRAYSSHCILTFLDATVAFAGGFSRVEVFNDGGGSPDLDQTFPLGSSSTSTLPPHRVTYPELGRSSYARTSEVTTVQGDAGAFAGWDLTGNVRVEELNCTGAASHYFVSLGFRVTTPTRLSIQSRFDQVQNPEPIFPVACGDASCLIFVFIEGLLGSLFDPPLAYGYRFQAMSAAHFTRITEIPDLADSDHQLFVSAGGTTITIDPRAVSISNAIDFVALTGAAVASFEIRGIDPNLDPYDPGAFAIRLEFDQPTADFSMESLRFTDSCKAGTVGGGTGTDVLQVNGLAGDENRIVTVPAHSTFQITLNASPAGPGGPGNSTAHYVVWAWRGFGSNPFDLSIGTAVLGCTINPTPFRPDSSPQPIRCLTSSDTVPAVCHGAGLQRVNGPHRAPWMVTPGQTYPAGFVVTLQGLLQDNGATNARGFSTTNAVTVQFQ